MGDCSPGCPWRFSAFSLEAKALYLYSRACFEKNSKSHGLQYCRYLTTSTYCKTQVKSFKWWNGWHNSWYWVVFQLQCPSVSNRFTLNGNMLCLSRSRRLHQWGPASKQHRSTLTAACLLLGLTPRTLRITRQFCQEEVKAAPFPNVGYRLLNDIRSCMRVHLNMLYRVLSIVVPW